MFYFRNPLFIIVLSCFCLSSIAALSAQARPDYSSSTSKFERQAQSPVSPVKVGQPTAFSRFAISGGFSPLGIDAQLSANLSSLMNLRLTGSLFDHSIHFNSDGFDATARLRLASARASLDLYPFRGGFRVSPGFLLYNQNRLTAADTIRSGSSFTLKGDTFYSGQADPNTGSKPVSGTALLNLHAIRPAFTLTGGWGNTISRNGHWSFPFEVGVAFVGGPKIDVNLRGWACHDRAETQCTDIANPGDPIAVQVQTDLHKQVDKWTEDLNPLRTYPIVSGGVSYSFGIGRR
jgi:hypothetical protein